MGVKDRLLEFLKYKGVSQRIFETQCGLSNGFVDKVGEGTRQSSLDKISVKYPELNMMWLRAGYGDMLNHPDAVRLIQEMKADGMLSEPSEPYMTRRDAEKLELQEIIKTLQETIKTQQETIKNLSETIKNLTSK